MNKTFLLILRYKSNTDMKAISKETAELLDSEAVRINSPAFIGADPVQFPRRYSDHRDIEIASLIAAIMAWGKRSMICRDIERCLEMMDHQPYAFMIAGEYELMDPERNLHRTLFAGHLQHLLRGLRRIYREHGSLEAFSHALRVGDQAQPAWHLVAEMQKVITESNDGVSCSRCLPLDLKSTALKRINMALRWLVRDDGIVDMGIWKSIPKSKLYIPLDVHVGNVSRQLGLLDRKANDRKSVVELTETLRQLRPEDPCFYDYALFGIGVGV